MGLPLLIIDGVEADDVIGTLAHRATANQIQTLVSTGDKDLAQLVNDHTTLMNTMTNEVLDYEGVVTKFGVKPDQIIDLLALMGDKADNIPGVPSVGPKTAVKWLQDFGSAEGIIANAQSIGGKVGEKLRDNFDQLRLSYELATVKLDVELDLEIDQLHQTEEDKTQLHTLFSELEFKTWVKELEAAGVVVEVPDAPANESDVASNQKINLVPALLEYKIISRESELNQLIQILGGLKSFCLNIEHTDGHFLDSKIFGIAICTEIGKAFYIPVGHDMDLADTQLDIETALEALKPLLESIEVAKIGYDLKHCKHVLANYRINLEAIVSDVLLQSYVANSVATKHQLDEIAAYYLSLKLSDYSSLLGKGKAKLRPQQLPINEFSQFANEKVDFTMRLSIHLTHALKAEGELAGLYRYYEQPLVEVIQRMERNGIKLNSEILHKQSAELGEQLKKIESDVYALAGEEFNLGSPKQLQSILYEKLEIPVTKKTKTGQPSTAEPVLQELAETYEVPRFLLQHRSLSKLKSTYTDRLPEQVHESSGRIHSSFQQAVAATGRLSSTDPNMQNIPIRTAEGRRVRQAFIADAGNKLVAADYSQVELRIMAHLSQDPGLLKAFSSAEDVHKATAADVFGVGLEEVTPEQRRGAKAINFGLIYGMSAFGLANQLNISRGDAQGYVDRYFEKYPGVRNYMDETQASADEKGYVETLFGRRLYLPGIHAGNGMIRKAAQRTAINAPMQGTAADIIKRAMIDIDHWLSASYLKARMVLQVHDELVFEVAEADLELLISGVSFRMTSAAALDVPLVVDVGIGNNWDEAH
jgi:DNA polymerase-1